MSSRGCGEVLAWWSPFVRRCWQEESFQRQPNLKKGRVDSGVMGCAQADRGWVPMGEEPAYEPGTISTVESFDCSKHILSCHPAAVAEVPGIGPNVWRVRSPVLHNSHHTCVEDTAEYSISSLPLVHSVQSMQACKLILDADNYLRR